MTMAENKMNLKIHTQRIEALHLCRMPFEMEFMLSQHHRASR